MRSGGDNAPRLTPHASRLTLHARATTGRGTQALPGGPADLLPDAQSLTFLLYSGTFLMSQPKGRRLGDESLRRLSRFGQFGINLLARRFRHRPGNPPHHGRAQDHGHADQEHERQSDVEPAPNDLALARLDHVPELAGNLVI